MPARTTVQLPEHVWDIICEHLCARSTDSHAVRRTYAALCLVGQTALTNSATRCLYRTVNLEYSSARSACQLFRRTVFASATLAGLCRSLNVSTALGSRSRNQDSEDLAVLLEGIMTACNRLVSVQFCPDENARNLEDMYLSAWNAASFTSFSLILSRFRDLTLLPSHPMETLTLQLAAEGDLHWDYDIFLQSWPTRSLQVETVALRNFRFPAYADQVMLEKLAQLCRAIHPPKRLLLSSCEMSVAALDQLLGVWSAATLEALDMTRCRICDSNDLWLKEYKLPVMPKLQILTCKGMQARVFSLNAQHINLNYRVSTAGDNADA